MSGHILVVLTNPTAGKEEEFNEWYTHKHLDEVIQIPGFVSARRFKLSNEQLDGYKVSSHRYLALYELEGDVGETLKSLHERLASGEIVLPASIELASIAPWVFTAIADRVSAT